MNIIRRNAERRHIQSGKCEMWLTFYPQAAPGPPDEGFGAISILNEIKLPSIGGVVSSLTRESELITYVHKGALALESPKGRSGVITAGEFQCMVIGRILAQRLSNAPRTGMAHFFRIYLRLPPSRLGCDYEAAQTRFTAAQRRNILCTVASPDARKASLRIHTDAAVYSSILDPGRHIVHELSQGRKAWLHIVYGRIHANDVELTGGDGMGFADEPSISLTVREDTELLLVDTMPGSGEGSRE
jgi:quercetin 2,3-dioxygenase